ncbi:MAG TPA: FtsX-like permease family protein [Candidatus Coprenecus pullistercoris]|nr:FtsX-like permease family protein [Candidatus Coprenecus pullistercoris]
MWKQIFRQLWYYRRGSAWLFVELVIIIAASWFIVDEIWTSSYRINNIPAGYDTEGVYCVYLKDLTPGAKGFSLSQAPLVNQKENLRRFGDALRAMPEVLAAAPMSMGHPGMGVGVSSLLPLDSVNYLSMAIFERECGSEDFDVFRYDLIYPENGKFEDVPGSILISEDLAEYLFPGQNPVGRTINDAMGGEAGTEGIRSGRIVGVVGDIKASGYTDNIPYVITNEADIVGETGGDRMYAFRLRPGVDGDKFLEKASMEWRKTMRFGNFRVQEVYSFKDRVDAKVRIDMQDKLFIWKIVWIFLIVNALLAVASIGWLRMEERRGEIGVRRAMGGSPVRILTHYMKEVWVIFAAAVVLGILITVNIITISKINIVSPSNSLDNVMPLNAADFPLLFDPVAHFLAVEGIVLCILLLAVTAAILIPAAGALRLPPVEALRDE